MTLLRSLGPAALVVVSTAVSTACHESSSDPLTNPTRTVNLGLAAWDVLGSGAVRAVLVHEFFQGLDLDGDGDLLDSVVHVIDLDSREDAVNTGLVLAIIYTPPPFSLDPPVLIADADATTLAFAVDESQTGGLDRNGDGDADDNVLAVYERDTRTVTNLGLATNRVAASADLVAFNVPEAAQGEDLDGDGSVGATTTVPFVHDRRTGETWNIALRGTHVRDVQGDFVALNVSEAEFGDRNGDGDSIDFVFELYDVRTRTVQHAGLAALTSPVLPHRGRWAFIVSEQAQGEDLDGDGDLLDEVAVVYDPRTQTARSLGAFQLELQQNVEPLVLSGTTVWLYDVSTDQLVDTGLVGSDVQPAGSRLMINVDETIQGEDLDRSGFLNGTVPVLYDPASGRTENLAIDGAIVRPYEGGLLVRANEELSQRDWNGDGELLDLVLFTWEERTGRLVNTRLAPEDAFSLGEGLALLDVDEKVRGEDLNGDGDTDDRVVHVLDVRTRVLTNLGLASGLLFEGASDKSLFAVDESKQEQDLNGDGDQDDFVLHLTEVLFFALRPDGGGELVDQDPASRPSPSNL